MSPQKKNIDIIHNCEEHLFNWLKIKMMEHGISIDQLNNLTEVLGKHKHELFFLHQHISQIQKWNKVKEECYTLSSELNGYSDQDDMLSIMVEKVAFDGQVLWLTIQEN